MAHFVAKTRATWREREREREREKERERERAYAGLTPSRAGRGSADGRLLSESMSRDV